jgi:hypothetical protein
MSALDTFIDEHKLTRKDGLSIVTTEDLDNIKAKGFTVEALLYYLCTKHGSLLHGSGRDITDTYLAKQRREIMCTDYAPVALLKAITCTDGLANLGYPGNTKEPFIVTAVPRILTNTIKESGFVYVVNNTEDFRRGTYDWEYITDKVQVPISAKLSILRADFKYPIRSEEPRAPPPTFYW